MKNHTNWVESTIEEVSTILDSKRKPISAKIRALRQGDIPYYGATGRAGWIDDYIFNEDLVLIGEDGAPFLDFKKNVAYPISGKSWVNNHAHVLKCKPSITSNQFILYFFNQFDFNGFVSGTTRLKLNQSNLKRIPFPLPPLAEQNRIVDKLDKLFGYLDILKERLEKIPQLLKDFRQSVLSQAVSGKLTEEWREGKGLKYNDWANEVAQNCCIKVQSGGTPKKDGFANSGFPFLKVYNIVDNKVEFDYRPQFATPEAQNSKIKKSKAYPGDVLMNIVGPPLNKVAIIPGDYKEWNLNQAITLFRPKEYLSNKFLYYFFREGTSVRSVTNETRGVVGQVNISLSQCRAFNIPIPSFKEQKEIVRRVESLFAKADKIEESYKTLKEKIDHLPQALLAKAFRGELVPQLASDGDARELLEEIRRMREALDGEGKKKKVRKKK